MKEKNISANPLWTRDFTIITLGSVVSMDIILLGNVEAVKAAAAKGNFDVSKATLIDPENYPEMDAMDEPPPMATMQSAPDALNARTPVCTFSMVGLGLMLE